MKRCIVSAVIALNFCGSLLAAVTENEIKDWLAVWQKREGLERWNIELHFVHQRELGRRVEADVTWWGMPGVAYVRYIYPKELETVFGYTSAGAREEAQHIVIHELMHLVLGQLYSDGTLGSTAWIHDNRRYDARMESITDNLAAMLLSGSAPNGVSVDSYIARQIDRGPWKPAPDVRERVILQIEQAMDDRPKFKAPNPSQMLAWVQLPLEGNIFAWGRWFLVVFALCIAGVVLGRTAMSGLHHGQMCYYRTATLYYRAVVWFYDWKGRRL